MLLYEYKVRDALERASNLAKSIREKCEGGAPASDLLRDLEVLKAACDQLKKILPPPVAEGSLQKRFAWADYWLQRDQPKKMLGDLIDIVDRDLPEIERGFREWCASRAHYDEEFSAGVGELLADRQLDSAMRKAFVLLKERLVTNFGVPSDVDGRDAVNKVFGRDGSMAGQIGDSERESMRNLLDGLFGVFRNTYGHHDVQPEWHEVEAVLSMVNWVLRRIDTYPRRKQATRTRG